VAASERATWQALPNSKSTIPARRWNASQAFFVSREATSQSGLMREGCVTLQNRNSVPVLLIIAAFFE
jgi:hypothetical protein